jgi:hypothetical protein
MIQVHLCVLYHPLFGVLTVMYRYTDIIAYGANIKEIKDFYLIYKCHCSNTSSRQILFIEFISDFFSDQFFSNHNW